MSDVKFTVIVQITCIIIMIGFDKSQLSHTQQQDSFSLLHDSCTHKLAFQAGINAEVAFAVACF